MSFFSLNPQPCIVFCGHPSLRFGDAVHFIDMWGSSPQNAILFTGKFSFLVVVFVGLWCFILVPQWHYAAFIRGCLSPSLTLYECSVPIQTLTHILLLSSLPHIYIY